MHSVLTEASPAYETHSAERYTPPNLKARSVASHRYEYITRTRIVPGIHVMYAYILPTQLFATEHLLTSNTF